MDKARREYEALVAIGRFLQGDGYAFTTITPASHAIANSRAEPDTARSLRDVFGWSRPFRSDSVPSRLLAWLEEADALETVSGLLRSKVRYSTLKGSLYVHSAFPTVEADAVFFGPDTYRFADLIERSLVRRMGGQVGRILDIGCGSGAGGLFLAGLLPSREVRVLLSDINSKALRYARVNAALGDKMGGEGNATLLLGDTARFLKSAVDIIVSNPPYLVDAESRMYRDGGGASGCELSLRIVRESLPLLAPGGMLILYTGTPVMEGRDVFREALEPILAASGTGFDYAEIDPDVFGEELANPAYASAERIAAVSLVLRR